MAVPVSLIAYAPINQSTGALMPGTVAAILNATGGTATLYTDKTGTATTGSNNVTIDTHGNLFAFVDPKGSDNYGTYQVAISGQSTVVVQAVVSYPSISNLTPAVFNVVTYGATGNGSTDDSAAITAANTAAHVAGGTVVFPLGIYKTSATFTISKPTVHWEGVNSAGSWIQPTNNSDCVRVQMAAFVANQQCGRIKGLTIDGSNASTSSCGLHYGDAMNGAFSDLVVQNFSGSSAIGIHMDNNTNYTEGTLWDRVLVSANKTGVLWEYTGGPSNSFGYQRIKQLRLLSNSGQIGMRLQQGALIYNGEINISGNFAAGSTFLQIAGVTGSGITAMAKCSYTIQVEVTGAGSATGISLTEFGAMSGHGVVDLSSGSFTSATAGTHPGTFDLSGWIVIPGTIIGVQKESGTTATTATAGSQTLPANPAAFDVVTYNNVLFKRPLYNT